MGLVLLYLLLTLAGVGGHLVARRALDLGDGESWALGRTLGLVAVAYPAWWAGVAGLAAWRWLGGVVLVVLGVAGAFDWWRRRPDWRAVVRLELVFLAAAAVVVWIRLERPAILHQEKLMDLGILASLLRAEGFPPPDMWLAGEGLPYYYWGALVWTVPLTLSRLPLDLSYNLVVAAVGGLAACLLWALGRRACAGRWWGGALAVAIGLFAGTPDGLRQLLAGRSIFDLDLWHSSRQVPDTITEWPLFSLWLGDLHPHLLSVPLALAAMLVAWEIGRRGPELRLVVPSTVLFGVSWAANPWAMPPTLAAVALLVLCGGGRWHWPGREGWPRWAAVAAIAVGGWVAGLPFHLAFHPPFQGVRAVFAWTPALELLMWGGVILLPVAAAAWALGSGVLGGGLRARAAALSVLAVTVVAAAATGRPTLVILALLLMVLVVAVLAGGAAEAERPAVALAALGVFLLLVPEVVYVVDSYGDKLHRMNTVFKSYAQAWVVLAIAFPALAALGFRSRTARAAAAVAIALCAGPHLVGLAAPPLIGRPLGLDGLAWLDPGDRAIVRELRTWPAGTTIVEAVGGAYTEYARISSASGVPALLGWANHEMVWRGHQVSEETERRRRLVEVIYRSGEPGAVAGAVAEAGVDLVVIGALERRDFTPAGLQAVRQAGEVVFSEEGGELVRFDGKRR